MAALVLVVGGMSIGAAGCGLVESRSCPSWVAYDTPADAARDATAVVAGRVVERAGSTTVFGWDAHVWTVRVDRWIKGSGDESIRVTSVPESCSPAPAYPDGDPFETAVDGGRSIVFLYRDGGTWRGITPLQAIVEATADGGIPDAWPPGSPGSPPPEPGATSPGVPPVSPTPVESLGVD